VRDVPEEAQRELKFEFASDVRQAIEMVLLPKGEIEYSNDSANGSAPEIMTPLEQDTEVAVS